MGCVNNCHSHVVFTLNRLRCAALPRPGVEDGNPPAGVKATVSPRNSWPYDQGLLTIGFP